LPPEEIGRLWRAYLDVWANCFLQFQAEGDDPQSPVAQRLVRLT